MNTPVSLEMVLLFAGILFTLGMLGVIIRRDILFMLLSVEIMLNSAGLAFIVASSRWGQPDGQVMFILVLAMAAAEVSVGLAMILQIYHQHQSLNIDNLKEMKG